MSEPDAFPVSPGALAPDDRRPVPKQLDLLVPSTRSSHRGPGLTGESLARLHRDFAKRGDHRRAERSRRRTWRRLT